MAQFIKDRKYKIERKITENYAAKLQGKTETVIATCVRVTECYATFSIEGKEDFRRMLWNVGNGSECVNYLRAAGCDTDDCISSDNLIEEGPAVGAELEENGNKFEKGQIYTIENIGICQDTAELMIVGRTKCFVDVEELMLHRVKTYRLKIFTDGNGECISRPASKCGNDIIRSKDKKEVDKVEYKLQEEGSEALETPAVEVETGKNVTELVAAMFEICNEGSAIGLAANQAGSRERVIVINTGGRKVAIINPVITRKHGGYNTKKEGCLSFPGRSMRVKRAKRINIVGYDADWNKVELKLSGMPARVVQHGIDRLAGRAF